MSRIHSCIGIFLTLALIHLAAAAEKLDTAKIEQLTGAKGKLDEKEGVFKVSLPRSELKAGVDGIQLTPPMGLTCWAAFKSAGDHTMVMGDQVLTENQVNPVMSIALENGLHVTALHNHFAGEQPRIMFMHIGGMGDADKLAEAVGKVFQEITRTASMKTEIRRVEIDPAKSTLDPKKIDAILAPSASPGELAHGVYKVTIGRSTKMDGEEVGNAMGVNTWAAFAGSDEEAVIDGDFAMTEHELQAVLKTLRGHDINVVAIHNHMTGETPRIMFLHFWAIGPAEKLAAGIKAALDAQGAAATHDTHDHQ
ncbi:MAG TPA: DUF1259 domain-containing protein [Tepidisphaeraceae bacterium]